MTLWPPVEQIAILPAALPQTASCLQPVQLKLEQLEAWNTLICGTSIGIRVVFCLQTTLLLKIVREHDFEFNEPTAGLFKEV